MANRIVALFLAVTLILTFTACSKKDNFDVADKIGKLPTQQEATEKSEIPAALESETSKEKPKSETESPVNAEPNEPNEPDSPYEPVITDEPSQGLDAYDNPCDHPHEGMDLTVFDGIYRATLPQGDDEETWLQITGYNDYIVLEYHGMIEGCIYRYWAEEFWPGDGWYTNVDDKTVSGKSQCFTSMAQYENYSGLPQNRCITLTDEGVVLNYDDSDAEYFVQVDSFGGGHSTPSEMRQRLGEDVHLDFDYQYDSRDVLGTWGFWTGSDAYVLKFEEDGTFALHKKTSNRPIQIYEGAYGFGTYSGNLVIAAERIGYGGFPYLINWEWYVDEYGDLNITDSDNVIFDGGCWFWPVEEEFFAAMDPDTALGYIVESFHEQGQYTDQYDVEYYYYYSLPQFYHSDHPDLQLINEMITDFYYPIIDDEMQAMEAGELLSYDHVDWQSAVYNGILFLHVYAYTYDWEEHSAFYIDIETMEQLDAHEVLARLEFEEDYFLDTVRSTAEDIFMNQFSEFPQEDWDEFGLHQCLEDTLSPDFVHVYLPIFVDRYGTITVYITISHPAGSGIMWFPTWPFEQTYEAGAVG